MSRSNNHQEATTIGEDHIARTEGLYWQLWSLCSFHSLLCLIRILWVIINNLYVIPVYFLYMFFLLPLHFIWPKLYDRIEQTFFYWILSHVSCWIYMAGFTIAESGDRLDDYKDNVLLYMPNHQSTADVPFCMAVFTSREGWTEKVMWIMDRIFKFTNFGWVSWMHDDFFILAGKSNRQKSLDSLRKHIKNVFVPKNRKYLVLFPEGGFLRKRQATSQSFAKKNDLPVLEYCTLPRTGALEVVMDILGSNKVNGVVNNNNNNNNNNNINNNDTPKLENIVDVTIAYKDGDPLDLLAIISGSRPHCTTHFHYRVFDVKNLPKEPEELKKWMYNLYAEKEQMLAKYYETGRFPYDMYDKKAHLPKPIRHDPLWYIVQHIFFLTSTLLLWPFTYGLVKSLVLFVCSIY